MQLYLKFISGGLSALFLVLYTLPQNAFAHQPRIPEGMEVTVINPEISKAYYSKLEGKPHIYRISAGAPFDLYVNVLVPDIAGQKKDVSALIIKDGNTAAPLVVLDSANYEWKTFFEPFGRSTYWQGPEYKARAEAGNYEIRVWSSKNDSKYSLAVGEIEAFDFKETMNALRLVPKIKKDFFNESPAGFLLSPMGAGYAIIVFLLSFVAGFAYHSILKRFACGTTRGAHKNLGAPDRMLRFAIGVALFIWAITTSWSPILLFFAGFAFFEAIFSWCVLYAVLGKNTCPV